MTQNYRTMTWIMQSFTFCMMRSHVVHISPNLLFCCRVRMRNTSSCIHYEFLVEYTAWIFKCIKKDNGSLSVVYKVALFCSKYDESFVFFRTFPANFYFLVICHLFFVYMLPYSFKVVHFCCLVSPLLPGCRLKRREGAVMALSRLSC